MTYIETLLKEKGISVYNFLLIEEGHIGLTIEMLVDFIYSMPSNMITDIEKTFRQIDFNNGNVKEYIDFLANGMVECMEMN